MANPTKRAFRRQMGALAVVSIVAWAVFLWLFRTGWPGSDDLRGDRRLVWAWLAVGTPVVAAVFLGTFRLLKTPPEWRSSAAIALSAPAFCLDAVATTFFHDWFPTAGASDNAAYAALILGSVGIALLLSLIDSTRGVRDTPAS